MSATDDDDDDDVEIDLASALGAEAFPSHQRLTLYIPDRDRRGQEIGSQRRWVLEGAAVLAKIGGGVTIFPPVEGGWFDAEASNIVWERPVVMYTYVKPNDFVAALPTLRGFLHRLGRETGQGEVALEFDGQFLRIVDFDSK